MNKKPAFPYILVSLPNSKDFMCSAYTIGSFAHCARFALKHGLRATTAIIDF